MTNLLPFMPTILLPEIYRPIADQDGFLATKIEGIAEEGFYKGVEIASIHNPIDRKRIHEVTAAAQLSVTQWMTALITEQNLDLSSINPIKRQFAVDKIKENIEMAKQSGASRLALITGPDPGEDFREKAAEGLYESLYTICETAKDYDMEVLVEPLDRHVHKKIFMGPTDELVEILSHIKKSHSNIGFAFDTAHAALNGEDIGEALNLARLHISQLHLSNAVLNPRDSLYGDYHIPMGAPGFLTFEKAVDILNKAKALGILSAKELRVSVEVRTNDNEDADSTEAQAKEFLQRLLASIEVVSNS